MSKRIYELVAYRGEESTNHLYPSMASATYHAKLVSGIEEITDVQIKVWVLDAAKGIYTVEKTFDQYKKGDVQ